MQQNTPQRPLKLQKQEHIRPSTTDLTPIDITSEETSTTTRSPIAMKLRPYQARIAKVAVTANTVVLLPTGAGKTLVAAEVITRIGAPAVMFVPTIPLVSQQASAFRAHAGMPSVGEYHGDLSVPKDFSVLVTTPKAFEMAQARGEPAFAWPRFGVVVFDEVHHVIKDHPYRNLALKLRQSDSGNRVRILGLTASLTYAVGATKIEKSVEKLCSELRIEKIENADDDELRRGGYRGAGRGAIAELRLVCTARADVVARDGRKPHLMHQSFFDRVRRAAATTFSMELVRTIRILEAAVRAVDSQFKSPLPSASLKTWGEHAHGRTSVTPMYGQLEHWYEALRLVVTSWEERDDAAVKWLQMMAADTALPCWPDPAAHAIKLFFATSPVSFERFDNLLTVLSEKAGTGSCFRGIIFVQQRIMTHVLQYVIENDPKLGSLLCSKCLYATATPASPSLTITKKGAKSALSAFATGAANLLIATNVAEEGLDIPEANCVIYFDPMNHAVSYVQGRGRARQQGSSFVMLDQREDRPASLLAKQEHEQHAIASTFAPRQAADPAAEAQAQRDRERSARPVLSAGITESTAVAKLNLYCKKTKVVCGETPTRVLPSGLFQVTQRYDSVLRQVEASGVGPTKKVARRQAAVALVTKLIASFK